MIVFTVEEVVLDQLESGKPEPLVEEVVRVHLFQLF